MRDEGAYDERQSHLGLHPTSINKEISIRMGHLLDGPSLPADLDPRSPMEIDDERVLEFRMRRLQFESAIPLSPSLTSIPQPPTRPVSPNQPSNPPPIALLLPDAEETGQTVSLDPATVVWEQAVMDSVEPMALAPGEQRLSDEECAELEFGLVHPHLHKPAEVLPPIQVPASMLPTRFPELEAFILAEAPNPQRPLQLRNTVRMSELAVRNLMYLEFLVQALAKIVALAEDMLGRVRRQGDGREAYLWELVQTGAREALEWAKGEVRERERREENVRGQYQFQWQALHREMGGDAAAALTQAYPNGGFHEKPFSTPPSPFSASSLDGEESWQPTVVDNLPVLVYSPAAPSIAVDPAFEHTDVPVAARHSQGTGEDETGQPTIANKSFLVDGPAASTVDDAPQSSQCSPETLNLCGEYEDAVGEEDDDGWESCGDMPDLVSASGSSDTSSATTSSLPLVTTPSCPPLLPLSSYPQYYDQVQPTASALPVLPPHVGESELPDGMQRNMSPRYHANKVTAGPVDNENYDQDQRFDGWMLEIRRRQAAGESEGALRLVEGAINFLLRQVDNPFPAYQDIVGLPAYYPLGSASSSDESSEDEIQPEPLESIIHSIFFDESSDTSSESMPPSSDSPLRLDDLSTENPTVRLDTVDTSPFVGMIFTSPVTNDDSYRQPNPVLAWERTDPRFDQFYPGFRNYHPHWSTSHIPRLTMDVYEAAGAFDVAPYYGDTLPPPPLDTPPVSVSSDADDFDKGDEDDMEQGKAEHLRELRAAIIEREPQGVIAQLDRALAPHMRNHRIEKAHTFGPLFQLRELAYGVVHKSFEGTGSV
ncbi:hypothetical protein C8F01DRAFT_1079731 [Mycena amicta]|nr:hypothetical protein C8F01DRAFT_1079731 [Mycena amicta]